MTNQIIYVVGKKGSGKTWLAKTLIQRFNQVFICDPNAEYYVDGGIIFENLDGLLTWLKTAPEKFIVICRFDDDYHWKFLFRTVYIWGNCTILLEELNVYVELFLRSEDEDFRKLTRYARHHQVNLIGVCQRAADTPRLFTAQCDTFISFLQSEPRDLKYIAERFGEEASRTVANLGEYEFAQFGEKIFEGNKI